MKTPHPLSLKALVPKLPTTEKALRALGPLDAKQILEELGDREAQVAALQTNLRFALGMLLLTIQDTRMFESHHLGGFKDWTAFLEKGFPELTNLRSSTAAEAMRLAKSKTLRALPPDERGKIPLTNAKQLVRLENGAPEAVTPEVVTKAQQERPRDFSRAIGAAQGVEVKVWVKDPAAAVAIERIMRQLATLSKEAAEGFAEFLETATLVGYAGNGADNRVHAILGHVQTSMVKELVYEAQG